MHCSCDVAPISFAVPPALSECAPGTDAAATICPRCLAVGPAESGSENPDFGRLHDGFPAGDAGVALALALGLLESLATNRSRVETALDHVERAGADPLLAIDRLHAEPTVEPSIELDRRRSQLESLLY